jgi:divinyl chlorophyllide a 8-vinyl-reductase
MHEVSALTIAPQRVLVLGGTGTIGQATVRSLQRLGHTVVCVVRARAGVGGALSLADCQALLPGAQLRVADVGDPAALLRDAVCGEHFDAVVSCLASRTGAPEASVQ